MPLGADGCSWVGAHGWVLTPTPGLAQAAGAARGCSCRMAAASAPAAAGAICPGSSASPARPSTTAASGGETPPPNPTPTPWPVAVVPALTRRPCQCVPRRFGVMPQRHVRGALRLVSLVALDPLPRPRRQRLWPWHAGAVQVGWGGGVLLHGWVPPAPASGPMAGTVPQVTHQPAGGCRRSRLRRAEPGGAGVPAALWHHWSAGTGRGAWGTMGGLGVPGRAVR